MFHKCKLVHADLSEYNILYHEGSLWIIDVSQSVEHDHPSAFDFLRNDIKNVEDFFGRLGVKCLGLRRCFEFITHEQFTNGVGEDDEEVVLQSWLDQEDVEDASPDDDLLSNRDTEAHEDSVFLQSFIPRNLNEVYDPERDVEKLARGEGQSLIYAKTISVVPTVGSKVAKHGEAQVQSQSDTEEEESDDDSGDESDSDSADDIGNGVTKEGLLERKPRGHRHEDREAKKVNSSR